MKRAFAAILLALAASPAAAQDLPEGVTMHRTQAGELDASGWTTASSTNGSYSIEVPCNFNDYTFSTREAEGQVRTLEIIGCQSGTALRFSATRVNYPEGPAKAEEYYRKVDFRSPGTTQEEVPGETQSGLPYRHFRVSNAVQCGQFRVIRLGEGNIIMGVETLGGGCFDFETVANRFFTSLEVTR